MFKKGKEVLSIALLVFLIAPMCCLVRSDDAEVDAVGVEPGDWVKYSVTRLGSDRSCLPGMEEAVWVKVEVLNVLATTVTIRETIHNKDGSEYVRNSSWNLQRDLEAGNRYIIRANLTRGDSVDRIAVKVVGTNKWVYVDLTLNDTDYRNYGGVTREVNLLKFSMLQEEYVPGQGKIFLINSTCELCWDRSTGFLCELKVQKYFIGYEQYPSIFTLEIVDTNMWEMEKSSQQTPGWWYAAIPVGIIILVVIAVKLRNSKKKNKDDGQR
ncbi:hypothetical protein DRO44_02830 [Candidatus Bathyarchaeota archaeon]|nr:MAG: hypothetical protein DRO44_02830 [Candidatus Bathyarchaeota archaeon]